MNHEPLHLDLFSGIGGFSLAFEAAGFRTIAFCEFDPDRQRDLRHHWPDVPIVGDINDIDAICRVVEHAKLHGCHPTQSGFVEAATEGSLGSGHEHGKTVGAGGETRGTVADAENERHAGGASHGNERERENGKVFAKRRELQDESFRCRTRPLLLTAGVPCQPASAAGKRKGSGDDRWLWPATLRVVERVRPDWCVFENPLGIASLAQPAAIAGVDIERLRDVPGRTICEILTAIRLLGYELPTDRDGVPWIPVVPAAGVGAFHGRDRLWIIARRGDVDYAESTSPRTVSSRSEPEHTKPGNANSDTCVTVGNAESGRCEQCHPGERGVSQLDQGQPRTLPDWSDAILEQGQDGKWRAVKPGLRLLANGIPRRTSKLRGFGNSICPQVAHQIAKAIYRQMT